ncbi:kinesin-like protein KIF26A isoform X2 [Betta splendens]|uniref:Kinesin-like protein KIF26A isoform X2 n=1 Tax=Betta splendens TaxID=158456 RepID=A0A9W2XLR4_BETSP|nr:kinesin-like protein KIF26A isoform X2 [Betta splendens]
MYSQYWSSVHRRRPDHRRFTLVEGDPPLPPDSTCRRKWLHSAEEEVRKSCASRPNPEGEPGQSSGSEDELQSLCQRCHIMASQLNRQAAALADTAALKDPAYASFLFDKLQRLQFPRRGAHASVDAHCNVCGASYQQLRRLALRRALGFSRDMTPRPATPGIPTITPTPSASKSCWVSEELLVKRQQGAEAPWGWGGVQSAYLGGGGVKALATVTPLLTNNLEGVWRVSVCRPGEQHAMGLTSNKDNMTMKRSPPTNVLQHAVHSVSTQTSQPPSAAVAFFIRAAQKLSLSHRKKSQPGPRPSPGEAPRALLYTGGFSGALQLSPPAVPPCLLRGGAKVKDTPGMGKVRVMVRICSVHSSESSESMSFLKVEVRKKQLTLCETAAGGRSSAPKTFTFDAVFSQDASQAEVCSGTVAGIIQSVVNGADGCIFCYGHANLGKTYTMIGRDCSTQSLGVAPTAISWLFKVIEEWKEKAGTRFSVRVSAVEISGSEETLTDLLADLSCSSGGSQEAPGPAVSLRQDPLCGSQLQNQTELLVTSAEQAAFYLDAALAARRSSQTPNDQKARRNSHFLFTLHLYQERADKSKKAAVSGRSRLHLLDLGSCDAGAGQCLSLSALGNVILALANGAKHIPYRDSKLTMLLSESLGNINCRTTMIAHISDSPANYMETLTTVQLASRIHRMKKKKSKYSSSSSGGDSSCEEGPSRRPPHLRPLHPRTVTLDPDTPLLLDPDYSSSSEHSCDTVIYIGPGGTTISDREVSDNEGPPSFVPIIPSLNKKQVKDAPKSDGDHLKCNTFAELQERLDCIDGSEGPAAFSTEAKVAGRTSIRTQTRAMKPDRNPLQAFSEHTSITCSNKSDDVQHTSADADKVPASPLQPHMVQLSENSDPVVQEKVYLRAGIANTPSNATVRTLPLGINLQALKHSVERVPCTVRCPVELNIVRASLLGQCLDTDLLRTTVTLHQPVELNGEDELVFTVVEDLPHAVVPDNGHPSNLLSFSGSRSLEAFTSSTLPVSIISSINDEYDAYMSQQEAVGDGEVLPQQGNKSFVGCWPSGDANTSKDRNMAAQDVPTLTLPSLQHGIKSSLNDCGVCFSELDSDPATPSKTSFTKCSPYPDLAKSSQGSVKSRAQVPHQTPHANLPKKTKPTSTAAVNTQNDLFQGSGTFNSREKVFLSVGRPPRNGITSTSSRSPGGNSNSVPRPPKAQTLSSAPRVVAGCEKSGGRRGETLIKLPQLTRVATTLGTVSVPQSPELKCSQEGPGGTLKFSSLGKKSNAQMTHLISKSACGSISPPTSVAQSSQEQSALKASNNVEKSLSSKTSIFEEEFNIRHRADSIRHRTSSLRNEQVSARTSPSLETQGAKANFPKTFGSLMSLERCDSQSGNQSELFGENSGAASGGNGKCYRSVPKLGIPTSTSTFASSSIVPQANKLGQVRGTSGSQATICGRLKSRTLSSSNPKSFSSSHKTLDYATKHNTSLPLTGKAQAQTGLRGTIMGTKQAISRAANSRVSELVAGSPIKQLGRGPGLIASDGTDSWTSNFSGSQTNTPLPSPYSKITAPRRPQRYSSGHGSDNSSVLSGELPPAMGRTALFYHSGGSSGYESMIRDSETTGSTSSAHDSMSESRASSSKSRASKSSRKRGNGFQRRRLIPAPLPDTSSLGRSKEGQWLDLKEPFEIKVYEIDDVERLQQRQEAALGSEQFHDVEKGLLYFNTRLRMLERRQQRITELKRKHERLQVELEEAKHQLMLHPSQWSREFDVDQDLDRESQEYLEALAQTTADLESCVNLCKSRVMMETCFDIVVTRATVMQDREV